MGEFDNALVLTTPHEISKRVGDAQWLMKGNSVFGPQLAPFKDQEIDRDYGLITAQAAARTKWWLGFDEKNCDPTFGQALYNLLIGHAELTDVMKKRRAERLAAVTPGQKAIELLRTHIGLTENPRGSNRQMFGEWYSQIMGQPWWNGVAWCAETESYCFWHTGYKRFIYASVEMIDNDARAFRNGLRIVWSPQQGDVVLYSIGGHTFAHTAFFDQWIDRSAGTFYDLGGNTGPTSISNGGAVMRQVRHTNIVHAYVRVG